MRRRLVMGRGGDFGRGRWSATAQQAVMNATAAPVQAVPQYRSTFRRWARNRSDDGGHRPSQPVNRSVHSGGSRIQTYMLPAPQP